MTSNDSNISVVASVDFPSSTLERTSFQMREINEVNSSTESIEPSLPGQSLIREDESQNANTIGISTDHLQP